MLRALLFSVLAIVAFHPSAPASEPFRSAHDVYMAAYGPTPESRDFVLCGTVSFVRQEDHSLLFSISDETGAITLYWSLGDPGLLRPGKRIKVTGHICTSPRSRPSAIIGTLAILGEDSVPPPVPISGPELASGRFDCQLTRISGIVRDVCRSELNVRFTFLVVNCQGQKVYVSTPASKADFEQLKTLVDTKISIEGICLPFDCTARANMGQVFKISNPQAIHPIDAPDSSDNTVPDIKSISTSGPSVISTLGRHRASGRVIAVWGQGQALLRTADGNLAQLDFGSEEPPETGDRIEAVGLPETDMFQVNLTHATWRKLDGPKEIDNCPQDVRAEDILTVSNDTPYVCRHFHGRNIRIRGHIVSLPATASPDRRIYLSNDSQLIPVEAQAIYERLADIPVGSLVEISGTCIMNTETWRPNMIFSKTKGFFLVTRTPDDIRVIARPSWWTPTRLMIIIGALFILSIGILVWNLSLQRLSERKGKALARATLAQSESALKVQERTRLATELHDSIVQNLTGVSLHLRTADKLRTTDPAAMSEQIAIAQRTVDSCRTEIRNCIWDLRNRALDEPNMDDAIQRTLAPLTEAVRLAIRFDVPRKCLTDNTTHNIICIIRELVLNAIRHGHATLIQIAGCLDGGQLLFSVKDNGIGFDVTTAPGIEQGHFGLQGVRERASLLQGNVTVSSSSGKGTKVSITVRMPSENRK